MNQSTRRHFLKTLGLAASAAALPAGAAPDRPTKKPNILFIMSDDHTCQAIGAYATVLKKVVRTPNIDRLADEGVRLENCFCTNSICVPSRATILTGQYSHVNGVYSLIDKIDPDRPNVAKTLRGAGYQTALIGKWHLKTEPSGFDYWNILPGQGRYHDPVMTEIGASKRETHKGFSTDVITDLSLEWLKKRAADKPFFLMTHFKNSHAPRHYAERHEHLFDGVEIPEPSSLWEDLSHRSEGSRGYGYTIRGIQHERMTRENYPTGPLKTEGMTSKEMTKATYQKYLKDYLRCVAAIDENVGRLLDYLDAEGLANDTVVFYTSDQGLFLGEHGYIDKRWMFEESLRMPFLARHPKELAPRSTNADIILNVDFAPTFLDFAGVEAPAGYQGRSFRPNLAGKTPSDWRESMYYRYWQHTTRPAHYGVRTKRHKLIFFYGLPLDVKGTQKEPTKVGWELYDLQKDPQELTNRYGDPAYAKTTKKLKAELLRLKTELGDLDENYPEMMKVRNEYWNAH